jgi:hypothetical protein
MRMIRLRRTDLVAATGGALALFSAAVVLPVAQARPRRPRAR